MIARTKILLIGLAGAATALLVAASGTAKAALPPSVTPDTPSGAMPWMKYSPATLDRQNEYNEWAAENGFPLITADGVLGPQTCTALTNWWQNGGPEVPPACSTRAIDQTCKDAAALRAEYFTIEARINAGEAFSGDEEHLASLYDEIAKLENLCGDHVLTGTGTRQ